MATMNSFKPGPFRFFLKDESGDERLCGRDGQVMVLSGACLSRVVERTESKM